MYSDTLKRKNFNCAICGRSSLYIFRCGECGRKVCHIDIDKNKICAECTKRKEMLQEGYSIEKNPLYSDC